MVKNWEMLSAAYSMSNTMSVNNTDLNEGKCTKSIIIADTFTSRVGYYKDTHVQIVCMPDIAEKVQSYVR